MKKKYSERLGVIEDSQIQKALDKHSLGLLEIAEPISAGLFGQNFIVTSDKGDFVFRGCPHYDWQFPSERFFAENLHNKTSTPVPYPYIVDQSTNIFGWSYVIMPKMTGISVAMQDPKNFETIELTCPEELANDIKENSNVEYWDIEGTKIIKRIL